MDLSGILYDQNPWWRDGTDRRARSFPVRRDLHSTVFSQVTRLQDRRAAVVVGPRQVGKTVLLLQVADDLLDKGWSPGNLTYFDFSDDRLTEGVHAREVVNVLPPGGSPDRPRAFLFDEVQRSPGWESWLRHAVDEGRHRFAATDSAASLLHRRSQESGLGRWDEHRMEGLTFLEYLRLHPAGSGEGAEALRDHPQLLERYLSTGGFPEHVASSSLHEVRARLRSAIAEAAILGDLSRFGVDVSKVKDLFVFLAQSSGAIFDAAKRARDLDTDPRSVRKWVELLQDALLVVPLPRHRTRAAARLRSKSKLYTADHGLTVAFAAVASPLEDPQVRGAVVEGVVFRHLRGEEDRGGIRLSYLRGDDGDVEVDFVVDGPRERAVVEVTSTRSADPRKIRRVLAAGRELATEHRFLIHAGVEEGLREGIRLVPLHAFLLDPLGVLGERSSST